MTENTEEELAVWSLFTPAPSELPLVAAGNGVRDPEPAALPGIDRFQRVALPLPAQHPGHCGLPDRSR